MFRLLCPLQFGGGLGRRVRAVWFLKLSGVSGFAGHSSSGLGRFLSGVRGTVFLLWLG